MAMIVYYVTDFMGEIQLFDHKQIRWVTIDEFDQYEFPAPDLPIIEKLREEAKIYKRD